jgi:hypothetical protein
MLTLYKATKKLINGRYVSCTATGLLQKSYPIGDTVFSHPSLPLFLSRTPDVAIVHGDHILECAVDEADVVNIMFIDDIGLMPYMLSTKSALLNFQYIRANNPRAFTLDNLPSSFEEMHQYFITYFVTKLKVVRYAGTVGEEINPGKTNNFRYRKFIPVSP